MLDGNWAERCGTIFLPYDVDAIKLFYGYIKTAEIDLSGAASKPQWSIKILVQCLELAQQYLFELLAVRLKDHLLYRMKNWNDAYEYLNIHVVDCLPKNQDNIMNRAFETIRDHHSSGCGPYSGCNKIHDIDFAAYDHLAPIILEYCRGKFGY